MNQQVGDIKDNQNQDSLNDFRKFFFRVIRYWYLIVASVVIAVGIAFLINRYTPPVYTISTSVLIKAPKDLSNSVAGLLYGDEVFKSSSNLENESILLKRFALVEKTIKDLDFNISYYKEGNIRLS
jgi:uncharacterized protein involved in exopolysaccharide biosynthesis